MLQRLGSGVKKRFPELSLGMILLILLIYVLVISLN